MINTIIEQLAEHGWCVMADFIDAHHVRQLAIEGEHLHQSGRLTQAGIGQGQGKTLQPGLRGDSILWLDDSPDNPAQQHFLQQMETLRLAANRELQLGLFELECHFARYPVGAGYAKHLDVFQQDSRRTLSTICYLNENWQPEHGGQLRIELEDGSQLHVLPKGGTLVCFLSHRFPHEVLPATRPRLSITGWFKRR